MIRRACFTTRRAGLGFTLTAIDSPQSPGLLMRCTFEGHRFPALPLVRPFAGFSGALLRHAPSMIGRVPRGRSSPMAGRVPRGQPSSSQPSVSVYPAPMASADFSPRPCDRRPFRREVRSPQVRTRSFTAQPPDLRGRSLTTKGFAAKCLLALIGRASLSGFCPSAHGFALRFLPTLGRPCAVALRFTRCGQLTEGLSPPRSRPCWAHTSAPWLQPGDSRCSGGSTANLPLGWLTLHRPGRPRRERSYLEARPVRGSPRPGSSSGVRPLVGRAPAVGISGTRRRGRRTGRSRCGWSATSVRPSHTVYSAT